ncbi:hypothetical protein KSP40_PGU019161 [Platanthera guangdongensis]|uniref:AAA+ ATPase domain-containing protein n=1 Tax=Platanthera guangdongensis TaxID=2320717 RepID=A0ABR2LFK0_9ASPA
MNDNEAVVDSFSGVKFYWSSQLYQSHSYFLFGSQPPPDRRYRLSFHRRHRDLVTETYLRHVFDEGRAIGLRDRQRRLYTNVTSYDSDCRKKFWSHVPFQHPATFDAIAMDPVKKSEIMEELLAFSRGKEFYLRIGKPWKRGYLLYGPPGTGKSTMIAAMANLLDYDIYDLELTAVKNNSALRKLLLDISSKSIIVIEDIDCSVDLSGKGKKVAMKSEDEKRIIGKERNAQSNVTLSGILNFIHGLWSACGGERLVVLTTNFVEKLDPALIRRGGMDRHIELSYCDFQGFRILARNYLGIEDHHTLFCEIRCLMEEMNITPADVAENLMVKKKSTKDAGSVEVCLKSLIQDLMASKLKSAKGEKEMMEIPAAEVKLKSVMEEEEEMVEATVEEEEAEGDAEEKESAASSSTDCE